MAFFDDLKKNASEVAEKAAKMTNDLTTLAKLNVSMKTCEAKLDDIYEEIGRLFYGAERNGEDLTEAIAEAVAKADNLKAEIADYRAKIAKLRKFLICDGCGNEIPEESAFCLYCGLKVMRETEESDDSYQSTDTTLTDLT